ncbi:hypothetical protein CPC08DRAFT_504291 [Agrocybe pediades]|nr:hypothetical protein CPC08DRAFT_504291 [Agrocybe pediades]
MVTKVQNQSCSDLSKTVRLSHRSWHPRNGRLTNNEADCALDISRGASINSYDPILSVSDKDVPG